MSEIPLNTLPRPLKRSLKTRASGALSLRTVLFESDCARQRARSTRFHTQRCSGSSFPWQSLALELIPNGSRPNN